MLGIIDLKIGFKAIDRKTSSFTIHWDTAFAVINCWTEAFVANL